MDWYEFLQISLYSTFMFWIYQTFVLPYIFKNVKYYGRKNENENENENELLNSRIVSNLHAIICIFGNSISYIINPEFHKDYNLHYEGRGGYNIVSFMGCISFGYFTHDLIWNILYLRSNDKKGNKWIFIMHHLVSMISIVIVLLIKRYYLGLLICGMMEGSTPFINNIVFIRIYFTKKNVVNDKDIKKKRMKWKRILTYVNVIFLLIVWIYFSLYFGIYKFWIIIYYNYPKFYKVFSIFIL